mmetsp:Transcript_21020/g.43093  ORF Transcript_21020/g.43093 Transcript_21020/m.43093 type:complete len:239 (+) Transcript_21020:822-1538(+)
MSPPAPLFFAAPAAAPFSAASTFLLNCFLVPPNMVFSGGGNPRPWSSKGDHKVAHPCCATVPRYSLSSTFKGLGATMLQLGEILRFKWCAHTTGRWNCTGAPSAEYFGNSTLTFPNEGIDTSRRLPLSTSLGADKWKRCMPMRSFPVSRLLASAPREPNPSAFKVRAKRPSLATRKILPLFAKRSPTPPAEPAFSKKSITTSATRSTTTITKSSKRNQSLLKKSKSPKSQPVPRATWA